jgi:23S rRNA (cytosine1962-C5)-methyltransferase
LTTVASAVTPAVVQVKVTPRGVARVRSGHPWIYRADVVGGDAAGDQGVLVVDERGKPLASALLAPPPATIALRVYARSEKFVRFDDALLAERLARAVERRRPAPGAPLPEAARLVHAEADQLPGLFVDKWGDAAVVQAATAAIERREPMIARWLAERLSLRLVLARDDGSTRELEGLPRRKAVLFGAPGAATVAEVREGHASFSHDLLEDAKTGGFLDQRENHVHVGELARGEALDAFSHHGGFALAMAANRAQVTQVTAIEQDPRAAARAAENARRSGLAERVRVETADAFVLLREYERVGRQFDTVVVDPPALAKRAGGGPRQGGGASRGPNDQALRAYKELNLRAIRLTRPDGLLVTCSCSGKVTAEIFAGMLAEAARDAGRDVVILERRGAASDHPVLVGVPETEYLKCWICRVL